MKKRPATTLKSADFARLFGTRETEIKKFCLDKIQGVDFSYNILQGKERDNLICKITTEIFERRFNRAGKQKKPLWAKGWKENLDNFIAGGYDPKALTPKYFHKNVPLRLDGNYIMGPSAEFEMNFGKVYRSWLFNKYMTDATSIYEFGSGSGLNIAIMAEMFPDKMIHGLDWVPPAKRILDLLAKHRGMKVQGHLFDLFHPDKKFKIEKGSVVLLVGVLEQLGTNFKKFIDYLVDARPALVVHVDSIEELYDPENLLDYLAISFGKVRNYLSGYLTYMNTLAAKKKVEMIRVQRVPFGNRYMDGYTYDIWRPRK